MEKSEDEEKSTAETGGEEAESTLGVTHTRRCCCSQQLSSSNLGETHLCPGLQSQQFSVFITASISAVPVENVWREARKDD